MADLQHDALTSADVHEPKNITINGVGASGKVITNSSSTPNISEYRKLALADIDTVDVYVTGNERDSTIAEQTYFVAPVSGTLIEVSAVISDPLVTADNIYTVDVAGVAPTPSTLTVTQAGSAQGDVTSITSP